MGIDRSPDMLADLTRRAHRECLDVRAVCADMRSLAVEGTFRVVIRALNTWLHLPTPEDRSATLAGVRSVMADEGRLLVDVSTRDIHSGPEPLFSVFENPRDPTRRMASVLQGETRGDRRLFNALSLYRREGDVPSATVSAWEEWQFDKPRFEQEAAFAGFEIEAELGDYAGRTCRAGDPNLLVILRPHHAR